MTISRVCTVGNCWQWANFTMGPNGQNQHFAELRQKVSVYIYAVVLLRGLPSFDGINELFVGKKRKKLLTESSQTDYSRIIDMHNQRTFFLSPFSSYSFPLTPALIFHILSSTSFFHVHTVTTLVTKVGLHVQNRPLILAPVDRTSVSASLYKHPCIICQKPKPRSLVNQSYIQ